MHVATLIRVTIHESLFINNPQAIQRMAIQAPIDTDITNTDITNIEVHRTSIHPQVILLIDIDTIDSNSI